MAAAAAGARVTHTPPTACIGIVVIGRNEGERLVACLDSIAAHAERTVYVDSGSTDGSCAEARRRGVEVVELDADTPFTAARARNAGLHRLKQVHGDLGFVQFVDGDCRVAEGWLERAAQELERDTKLAVVCGRRREVAPEASVYNRLCDLEWDTSIGDAAACGGDAMMRLEAFEEVDGFDESLIAGEEPELCYRLRRRGWGVRRIDADMTAHDAAMTRFGQWWRRMQRAGHAYAEGAALHGAGDERYCRRDLRRIVGWALGPPVAAAAFAWPTAGWSCLALAAYPLLGAKIALGQRNRGRRGSHALLYAGACVIGKWPQCLGALQYRLAKLRGRRRELIEYKSARQR